MVNIVYGVAGEGSGHSSRAQVIARHLIRQGHDLRLASYDRGFRNLSEQFDVLEIEGLSIETEDNRVSIVKTFTENLKKLPKGHESLQRLRRSLFKDFQPDVVITDFEPMTAYLAMHYDLPLITIDNQHRMRYMDAPCPPGLRGEHRLTKTIIRAMVPRPDVSLAITFYQGPATNERTFFFPPILRREVLDQPTTVADHTLVYLTRGSDTLLDLLPEFPYESFRVYGYDRDERAGNVWFRPFSRTGFLQDLSSCRAVIATAGFTLISEALYLRKPYLALPMSGQYEQQLNGYQLAALGYGKSIDEPLSAEIGDFYYRLPEYARRLAEYDPGDPSAITRRLDQLLAHDAEEARRFHQARRG